MIQMWMPYLIPFEINIVPVVGEPNVGFEQLILFVQINYLLKREGKIELKGTILICHWPL